MHDELCDSMYGDGEVRCVCCWNVCWLFGSVIFRADFGVLTLLMELTILLATRATLLAPDGHEFCCWYSVFVSFCCVEMSVSWELKMDDVLLFMRAGEGRVDEPPELEEEMSEAFVVLLVVVALVLLLAAVVLAVSKLEAVNEFCWLRLASMGAGRKVMNTLGQLGEISWNLRSHSLWQRNLHEHTGVMEIQIV